MIVTELSPIEIAELRQPETDAELVLDVAELDADNNAIVEELPI